jgi:hypothetical protein
VNSLKIGDMMGHGIMGIPENGWTCGIWLCILYMTWGYHWDSDSSTCGIIKKSPTTWPEPSTVSLVPARGLRWIGPWTSGPREDSWPTCGAALDWLSRHFSMITCHKRVVVSKLAQNHWSTFFDWQSLDDDRNHPICRTNASTRAKF